MTEHDAGVGNEDFEWIRSSEEQKKEGFLEFCETGRKRPENDNFRRRENFEKSETRRKSQKNTKCKNFSSKNLKKSHSKISGKRKVAFSRISRRFYFSRFAYFRSKISVFSPAISAVFPTLRFSAMATKLRFALDLRQSPDPAPSLPIGYALRPCDGPLFFPTRCYSSLLLQISPLRRPTSLPSSAPRSVPSPT